MRVINSESSTMTEGIPSDAVGRRVVCDGERGTVRYVGTVPPTAGVWLGVEWDNPERGKHDGNHEGVYYFTCRHPTGGSFVRPKKVSFGVDFLTAMKQRYELELKQAIAEEIKISIKTVQLVGFEALSEKQRLENLTEASVANCDICGPGPENEIKQTTPNICTLNLSSNLLSTWEDVARITHQLEKLHELDLSHNRLRLPAEPASLSPSFRGLKVLALNNCALTWMEVLEFAPMWPQLKELYLYDNAITELHSPVDVLQSLTLLDLTSNPLTDGSDVLKLAELPRLEELRLSNTGLSSLQFNDVGPGGKTTMFPALRSLVLDDNNIAEWSVVNELDKLARLQQLSINRNPLMSGERNRETARQLLIARVAQLEFVNKIQVPPDERKGAELDYCKMFGEKWLESGGSRDQAVSRPSEEFTAQHPRYQSLIQKYGAPEEGEMKKQKPFALKNQLLTITFVCPDASDRKPIEKKLPDSMIVQKMKGLLFRLLKIPGSDLKLTYTSSKMEGKEIEIDNDLKPLQFYSIEDGDKVLVRWT
ncbi:tubulin-specific chaperone E [Megalops cyprinoides]|uniref:tubulin-specific chaperone E n=1 Tax=Megalops cyprinoides TaxID=118141 RepID=UPI0018651C8F|nr:tubulin-specific chaperone E [Megalops cyprinoides]